MLGPEPSDIATFLAKTEGLDKTTIGDYLGERDDTCLKVGAQCNSMCSHLQHVCNTIKSNNLCCRQTVATGAQQWPCIQPL